MRFNWWKRPNFQEGGPVGPNVQQGYFISAEDLRRDAAEFIRLIETDHTAVRCKCRWRIHPDDVMVKAGCCRVCGEPPKHEAHRGLPEDFEEGKAHHYLGIRRVKVDTHPECSVHTKEGLLIGFLEWVRNG